MSDLGCSDWERSRAVGCCLLPRRCSGATGHNEPAAPRAQAGPREAFAGLGPAVRFSAPQGVRAAPHRTAPPRPRTQQRGTERSSATAAFHCGWNRNHRRDLSKTPGRAARPSAQALRCELLPAARGSGGIFCFVRRDAIRRRKRPPCSPGLTSALSSAVAVTAKSDVRRLRRSGLCGTAAAASGVCQGRAREGTPPRGPPRPAAAAMRGLSSGSPGPVGRRW